MNFNQHFMKPTKLIVAIVATLMSTAALSAPAFAGDNKVYPGSNCKPNQETGTTGLYYGNAVDNLGTVAREVVCPVVRDDTIGGSANAQVYVNSNAVGCTLYSANVNGATYDSRTATGVAVSGVYRIDIPAVAQVSQGAYHIGCNLPSGTSVLQYSVGE
jgi:hypothetical protein